MLADGADILDLGAYSSRPGAADIPEKDERRSIQDAVKLIKSEFPDAILSVDTFRSTVASAGLEAGADMINDISGGDLDKDLPQVVADHKVPYIIMHTRGNPQNMYLKTKYEDVTKEVCYLLKQKIERFNKLGIHDIIADPGIGFAKSVDQNFELLANIDVMHLLDVPLLFGVSRKSFIQKTLDTTPEDSLNGTTAIHAYLACNHCSILRVHDVKEAVESSVLLSRIAEFSKKAF